MTVRDVTPTEEKVLEAAHDFADALSVLMDGPPEDRNAGAVWKYVTARDKLTEAAAILVIEPGRPAPSVPVKGRMKSKGFDT